MNLRNVNVQEISLLKVYLTNIEKKTFYNIKLRKLMHKLTI